MKKRSLPFWLMGIHGTLWAAYSAFVLLSVTMISDGASLFSGPNTADTWRFLLLWSHIQVLPYSTFVYLLLYFITGEFNIKVERKNDEGA